MPDTKTTLKLACCMARALGTAALAAQQRSITTPGERGDLDEIRKVSALIGTHIMNPSNTKVADVRDLVLSPEGSVLYAILGHGGVAGVGETYTAAPFDALEGRTADGKWTVAFDKTAEDLKKAPTIRSENYRELTDPQWIARVNQFFHSRGAPKERPERATGEAQGEPRAVERVLLATKIRAARLSNVQNEDLGKVEDLLLDRMHRVAFVIVGRGGVLGLGENHIPIPWSKLSLGVNQEKAAVTVSLDSTKAQLEKAPLVKGDNYATLLAPGFADEVRRYFNAIGRGVDDRIRDRAALSWKKARGQVMNHALRSLVDAGTKVWLDSIDPAEVARNRAWGITGATSNPIIVSDLIKTGRLDDQLARFLREGLDDEAIAWRLTDLLVSRAQEVFLPVWEATRGDDGYVSFELDPLLEDPDEAFAGSDIETNPPGTNARVQDSGRTFIRAVDRMPPDDVLAEIDAKVDMEHLEAVLMAEGVKKFADPQKALLALIARKRSELGAATAR